MKGQSSIETLASLGCLALATVFGFILMVNAAMSLVLVKWAELNSQCTILEKNLAYCEDHTKKALENWFAFKNLEIKTKTFHGIVKTTLKGQIFLGKWIVGHYELRPQEYKRVR